MRATPALAAISIALLLAGGCSAPDTASSFTESFQAAASLERFTFSDPDVWYWTVLEDGDGARLGGAMGCMEGSSFKPPHRSPRAYALVRDIEYDAFILEAEVRQTGREYGHRDLCFLFSFESPAHFGYVHLAPDPDQRAHNVFSVHDAPRVAVCPVPEKGIEWGQQWHTVRIERLPLDGRGGDVRVFFDGALIHTAPGGPFGRGRVGFGSFDDSGMIRSLSIRVPGSEP